MTSWLAHTHTGQVYATRGGEGRAVKSDGEQWRAVGERWASARHRAAAVHRKVHLFSNVNCLKHDAGS